MEPLPNYSSISSEYEMPEDARQALQKLYVNIAKDLERNKDKIIEEAVTLHLGRNDWNPLTLAPRIKRGVPSDSAEECWYLDGHPLVTFRPTDRRVSTSVDKFVAQIHYRVFPKPARFTCNHKFEVFSPIDTEECCVFCGAKQTCEPLIEQQPRM